LVARGEPLPRCHETRTARLTETVSYRISYATSPVFTSKMKSPPLRDTNMWCDRDCRE
jgi:hypothetical protein